MRIKSGFVIEEVAGSYLACATGKLAAQFSALIRLNESGAFFWNTLSEGDISEQELIEKAVEAYGVGADVIEPDVKAFLDVLRKNGILEESV
jgi:hypothetical protein